MTKSFAEILKEIFEDIIKEEKEQAEEQNRTEKTIEVLDRDITFGVRDRVCKENRCGSTDCPLYVDGDCIKGVLSSNNALLGIGKEYVTALELIYIFDKGAQSFKGAILVFAGKYKLSANHAVAVIVPTQIRKKGFAFLSVGAAD